ncbi:MAG: ABC transporter ATP-binding protein [Alphaproteobacteria bacterium]|nr:ABC transporter ATP-binding protein [Alphaproteobacteria bacterium]
MASTILSLRDVTKRYGATLAVGPISLEVETGEFLTLLGPSGCGKTTTLHIIAGLLHPDEGRVTMGERDLTRVAPPYRDMGLVFQNYALFPHKTIAENVAFGLRMRNVGKPEIARRVAAMLDLVGLPGVEGRFPDQLSGGQRQRVALARALVIEPTVLLLDEPLSNLDALLRKRMRLELRDIQRRLGITTIFVTHDQDEAFEMSDRVALLNAGRIEQLGPPEALYDAPATRFVAEFIGEASLLEGRIVGRRDGEAAIELPGGTVVAAAAGPGTPGVGQSALLFVRPERVSLGPDQPGAAGLRVRVERRVFSGEVVSFALRTESGQSLLCKKPSVGEYRAVEPGTWLRATPIECRALAAGAP